MSINHHNTLSDMTIITDIINGHGLRRIAETLDLRQGSRATRDVISWHLFRIQDL